MTSTNWLPFSWEDPHRSGKVFRTTAMRKAHMEAVRSWNAWNTRNDDGLEDKIIRNQKEIKQQSWMGFGMLHLANNRRSSLYWFLASVVFLLMAVYAEVEEFPGGVEKPLGVR